MMRKHVWSAMILGASLAVLAAMPARAEARSAKQPTASPRSSAARRAALRQVIADRLAAPSPAAASAPAGAAIAGDALTIYNSNTTPDPRYDLHSVQVGSGGGASLLFTITVEQYTDPLTDPQWISGAAGAFWLVDTSGDTVADVVVEIYNDGVRLAADVFDPEGDVGTFVCDAGASSSPADRSYTVTLAQPGCLGDVKQPAVAGAVFFNTHDANGGYYDFAPLSGIPVRFKRPNPGVPEGGYAIVSRSAGFQRFGAMPPGVAPSGTFSDYVPPHPLVATAGDRPFDGALWSVTDNGQVSTQDQADFYGDAITPSCPADPNAPCTGPAFRLAQPIVGMAVKPDFSGYWLVARDGGIFSFGDAGFYGSTGGLRLAQPIVGMASSPTGKGYWMVAADGGIFAFGDAAFHGSTGALRLQQPVVGMAAGLQGQGYWLVARDGGVFSFGLPFYGSTGNVALQQPIVGMSATRSGGGYRFVARDGGVFSFGDAEFWGSGAAPRRSDVVAIASA